MPKITVEELFAIAKAGGGFEIDAIDYTPSELMIFVDQMCQGARMRIRNAALWKSEDRALLAQAAPPGAAEFVF